MRGSDFRKLVPSYLNETIEHVEGIINFLHGKEHSLEDLNDIDKYIVNSIQKNNEFFFNKTARAYLCSAKGSSLQAELGVKKINKDKLVAVSRLKMVAKVFVNWTYCLLGCLFSRSKGDQVLVRSWVDVSLDIYGSEGNYFLVYPFGLNFIRQVSFIRHLKRNKIGFQLAGYKYSFFKLIKWLFSGRDVHLAELEISAYSEHAVFILNKFGSTKVLTTDDFEPASFVLNKVLINNDVVVENSAHGVGRYSPFICYSRFRVFNTSQRSYYEEFSPRVNYIIYGDSRLIEYGNKPSNVVFVDQLLVNDGSALEQSQRNIFSTFETIEKKYNVKCYIKMHPNSRADHKEFSRHLWTKDFSELDSPVFFTFFSTAYLTFQKYGPTYLLENEVFDPRVIFGAEARVVSVSQFEDFICNLLG